MSEDPFGNRRRRNRPPGESGCSRTPAGAGRGRTRSPATSTATSTIEGRADHAGATPMDMRLDAAVVAAEAIVELERLARGAGRGTVGTVGRDRGRSGADQRRSRARARISLDVRGPDDDAFHSVVRDIARSRAARPGARDAASYRQRQTVPPTRWTGASCRRSRARRGDRRAVHTMISGAAHDTMCVAERVPAAHGLRPLPRRAQHTPDEDADPADAALGVEIILGAISALLGRGAPD